MVRLNLVIPTIPPSPDWLVTSGIPAGLDLKVRNHFQARFKLYREADARFSVAVRRLKVL